MPGIRLNGRAYGGVATVTSADHLTVQDGSGNQTNAQSLISNILGDFGTVETSTSASKAYAVGDYLVLNGNLYKVTSAIAAGGTINIASGGNVKKTTVGQETANRLLDFVNVAVSAGTGDIATINDARITADHKVAGYNIVWGNPSYITSNVTVTTSAGQAKINGTCTAATTATFQLVKSN